MWEPFLNHDAGKWDSNDIEKTHLQFIKRILGVNRSTTNSLVRGETHRHTLREEILRRNINYASYIHNKNTDIVVKQAYLYELSRKTNQITFMNSMGKQVANLHALGLDFFPFKDPYENLYIIPEEEMKVHTHQIFQAEWKTKLEASTKADTYRKFKTEMKAESYIKTLNIRKERVAFTKFRVSDHKLYIETGRHQRPIIPRENRFCFICANKIEDEQHFLLECKLYGSQNKFTRLIENSDDTFTTLTNDEKFIHLMTQEDEQTTEHIAKEIRNRQNLRDLIYEYFFQPEKNP